MNRTLSIVLCSSVVCTSIFSADTSLPSSSSSTATTTPDPLAVPPVKPWVQKAREQKEQNAKKPDLLNLLLKNVTGKEEEGKRFHDDPSNRRMIEERVEKLIVNLNHASAQKTEEFLMICEQKGIEISHDASAELFKAAYENRVEREKNYVYSLECYKQCRDKCCKNQVEELKVKLEQFKKQTESQSIALTDSYAQHKTVAETHTKIYTNIMLLTRKLNPQFAPAYATNPALYYDDLEKQFGLKIKMKEQTAFATHGREISKLLAALKQFGNIDMEQVWFEKFLEHWRSEAKTGDEISAINKARHLHNRMIFKASQPAPQQPTPSQTTNSSESESAEAGQLDTELQTQIVANQVQPSSTSKTSKTEREQYDFGDVKGKVLPKQKQ